MATATPLAMAYYAARHNDTDFSDDHSIEFQTVNRVSPRTNNADNVHYVI